METANKYTEIFLPTYSEDRSRIERQGGRFVYYTTASTAIQILRNAEVWMRSTLVMNDFMEVDHGISCVVDAYLNSDAGRALKKSLEHCFEGVSGEIERQFDSSALLLKSDTFVTCVSEHLVEEDEYGRLSMWRAYGGAAGVALVIKAGVFFQEIEGSGIYSSPVVYSRSDGVGEYIFKVANAIVRESDYVRMQGRDWLKNSVFHMLRNRAICTKHMAFKEEREWRVIASPLIDESGGFFDQKIEVVGGVPQQVLKVKLVDRPEKGWVGFSIKDMIDRILIGPSDHAVVIHRALYEALREIGIENPEGKIVRTNIPLRSNQR